LYDKTKQNGSGVFWDLEKIHLIYCDFSLLIRTFARKFYLHGCAISAVAGK
jgi:hypothetical protein